MLINHGNNHADASWDIGSRKCDRSLLIGHAPRAIEEGDPKKKGCFGRPLLTQE